PKLGPLPQTSQVAATVSPEVDGWIGASPTLRRAQGSATNSIGEPANRSGRRPQPPNAGLLAATAPGGRFSRAVGGGRYPAGADAAGPDPAPGRARTRAMEAGDTVSGRTALPLDLSAARRWAL